ncbi:hypothetical protein F511_23825 [Dorcoceras hygrometricum]|uniref:Splicing factor 3B subunit 1-like n=1 Tax=Dorcoceras hygrometricum TaxID=472368 RepID=A0A2Z7C847_9LAMI|nr:hypothetical protein F511_23825 [Dorcoceras hygrometricum]
MAASIIQNTIQINFDSVLSLSDEGIVTMFKTLESTGLRGFLGCFSAIYEGDLETFFANAIVRGDSVISSVQGKFVEISEELFAGRFDLPSEGLTSVDELPKGLIKEARKAFSASGEPIKTSCKKKEMKVEFILLNDILAKAVTAKAGSFDVVTHKRYLLMATIHGAAKRRPAPVVEPVVKKQRTTVGRAAPTEKTLVIVPVVQEAVPISVLPAESPSAKKCQAPKRKLILQAESDEEASDKEIAEVETETDTEKTYVEDKVEKETTEKSVEKEADEEAIDSEDTEPLSKVLKLTETSMSDKESMSIDDLLKQIPEDMMLPSITTEEPTKIGFGHGREIKEVDWYKATLPKIDPMDKGKAPLVEEIKGNPAKEIFALIYGDIEFLVHFRMSL